MFAHPAVEIGTEVTEVRRLVQARGEAIAPDEQTRDGESEAGRAEARYCNQKRSAAGSTLPAANRPLLAQVQAMKHKGRTDKSARPLLD